MKRYCTLILFCFALLMTSEASPADSVSTVYRDGEFVSYCRVWVNASTGKCESVCYDFAYQMCYNLDGLFNWGLKGMNLRKENNDIMMFYFKSTSFNKNTNILISVGDVIVPGIISVPDVKIASLFTTKKYANGKTTSNMDLVSSNGLLKNMHTSFSLIPHTGKGNWFVLESHARFGWFFNIFITRNRYKTIMEWRLKQYVHNLRDEAERRESTR